MVYSFMVFNGTFYNISVISWRSVLLVAETGENHRPVAGHWQTLSNNVVSSTPRHEPTLAPTNKNKKQNLSMKCITIDVLQTIVILIKWSMPD